MPPPTAVGSRDYRNALNQVPLFCLWNPAATTLPGRTDVRRERPEQADRDHTPRASRRNLRVRHGVAKRRQPTWVRCRDVVSRGHDTTPSLSPHHHKCEALRTLPIGCYGTPARPIPTRCGSTYPQTWGILSVEIRDQPVVCRRFVPTGSVQGLVPSERTSTGEILDDTCRLRQARNVPIKPGVHFRAGKPALGAMNGRVERRPRFGSFHSVGDHRVVPYRAAGEVLLVQGGGRRALAPDPKIPFLVRFTPGMIMVAVHHPRKRATNDPKTCVRIVSYDSG
jgi:hypothetical protein